MTERTPRPIALAALALCLAGAAPADAPAPAPDPEAAESRALAYLAAEVPRWARENGCYSCHNNGDAARALYLARRRGRAVPPGDDGADPLADTTRWLARPEGWDDNGGDGAFSDKPLARVQFTAALAAAIRAGKSDDRAALRTAAGRLAADQAPDGSWPIEDGQGAIGTPAAYGRPLATLVARDALREADPARFRPQIERADAWLRRRPVARVMDASVALLAHPDDPAPDALRTLRDGRSPDGGWGPFVDAPPEPFDTALALLALAGRPHDPEARRWIREGRAFLARAQNPDGSWPETTRPAGLESYAQRLSTTGWAALALLATRP